MIVCVLLIAAARDGKGIKAALEQAIALDPQLHDAYFGIGLYHYYPAVAQCRRSAHLIPEGT